MKILPRHSIISNMRTTSRYVIVITVCIFGAIFLLHRLWNEQEYVEGKLKKSASRPVVGEKEFKPGRSRSRVVFYNRVGKCGSRSILYLANRLSKLHNFTFLQSRDFDNDHPSRDEALKEMKKIAELKSPMFYNRHIHYLDFKKYGYQGPIYINVVRDPIERFASQYNYVKYGDGEAQVKNPKQGWPDINDCVMKNIGICNTNFMFYTGMYFCGFDEVCETPSKARVQLAKKHIDESYTIIGVMEEFENTLRLLQRMLPEYFLGAVSNFKKNSQSKNKTSTKRRDVLTEEAKEKLRNVDMKDEYEVFNHAKRKFEKLKKNFGIYN